MCSFLLTGSCLFCKYTVSTPLWRCSLDKCGTCSVWHELFALLSLVSVDRSCWFCYCWSVCWQELLVLLLLMCLLTGVTGSVIAEVSVDRSNWLCHHWSADLLVLLLLKCCHRSYWFYHCWCICWHELLVLPLLKCLLTGVTVYVTAECLLVGVTGSAIAERLLLKHLLTGDPFFAITPVDRS